MLVRRLVLGTTLMAIAAGWSFVVASVVDRMSFEEAAKGADVVVLGCVVESPEMAVYNRATGQVTKQHRFHVERFLKGEGPEEILVTTFGGTFESEVEGQPRTLDAEYGGAPQAPPPDKDVLLFLRRYQGPDSYIIYSASHGVVSIRPAQGSEERSVSLFFRNPAVMPEAAHLDFEKAKATGYTGRTMLFSDRVPLSALPELMSRVLSIEPPPPVQDLVATPK